MEELNSIKTELVKELSESENNEEKIQILLKYLEKMENLIKDLNETLDKIYE